MAEIKPEQVPMTAWRAALEEYYNAPGEEPLRRAIAAALNAWPGMEPHKVLSVRDNGEGYDLKRVGIILPLLQEPQQLR